MENQSKQSEAQRRKGHFRPVWITSFLLLTSITLTLLYFQEIETAAFFPGNILVLTLIELNVILLILLVLLLSRNLIKHYFERRQKVLGSGFRGKLIAAFVGFSSIPAILLFIVASGLLTSSIENWFSIQVERPLDHALRMAQLYYQKEENIALDFAKGLSLTLSNGPLLKDQNHRRLMDFLEDKRTEYHVAGVELFFNGERPPIRIFDPEIPETAFLLPPSELLDKSFSGKVVVHQPMTLAGTLIRTMVPIENPLKGPILGVLMVEVLIPETLVENMEDITRSFEDYKQLKAFKNPIKEGYLLSFVIITMVILFSATWFGFYLAKGITVPLQQLAEGTRAVAQGNLDFRIPVKTTDELGVVVDSFNKMTRDLQIGKSQLEEVNRSLRESNQELDQRHTYIETVLQNIATGIFSLDSHDRVTTVNFSAEQIFQIKDREIRGKLARDAFEALQLHPLLPLLDEMEGLSIDSLEREVQIEVSGRLLVLKVALSRLRNEDGKDLGKVMVVEDLTELIKAQKSAAWKEVAQRIAHEIKNPLTPIQLSAQRVRKKFLDNAPDFPAVLEESSTTIMNEVGNLKHLVDEFSQFARLPAPRFSKDDIHSILQEVIKLYRGAHRDLHVHTNYDKQLPLINLDREQIRRVFVNLFENAIESMDYHGELRIETHYDRNHRKAIITVSDNGPGILPEDQNKLFMPYFSRKKSGTGLGLAIVHRIIQEHDGTIHIANRKPHGVQVTMELTA